MSKGKVVVLGVNGHIGHAVAQAFVNVGWDVTGMARSDKGQIPGVRYVKGDSDSVEDMRRAIGDADVVVNALNMKYDQWFNGRKEAMMARVLEAMGTSGKTMLFPGTIYNYAADNDLLTPDLPQNPPTPRGAIRVRIEQMFEAAADRGDIQFIVLRAGDFFGPDTTMDWFDQLMMSSLGARLVMLMGTRGVGHSWAYLPDLSRAFEALASIRRTLGHFERFHFAGYHVTPEQMAASIQKATPVKLHFMRMPFVVLRAWGLFDTVIREIARMRYIWKNPLQLSDKRLEALLGPDFGTPFDQAVAATVKPFLATAGLEAKPGTKAERRLA